MVEAEGYEDDFDRRRSAKRALLVGPPPRGADCPKPVSGDVWLGVAQHPGCHDDL